MFETISELKKGYFVRCENYDQLIQNAIKIFVQLDHKTRFLFLNSLWDVVEMWMKNQDWQYVSSITCIYVEDFRYIIITDFLNGS